MPPCLSGSHPPPDRAVGGVGGSAVGKLAGELTARLLSSPCRNSELTYGSLKQPSSSAFLPQTLQPHALETLIFITLELQHIRNVPINVFPPPAWDFVPPHSAKDTGLPSSLVTFQRGRQSLGFQWPPSLMEGSFAKNWWISSIVISLIFTSMGPSAEAEGRSRRAGQEPLWSWGSSGRCSAASLPAAPSAAHRQSFLFPKHQQN